jgi:hypothetical protein
MKTFFGVTFDLSISMFLRAFIAKVVSFLEDPIVNPNLFKLDTHLSSGIDSKQWGL